MDEEDNIYSNDIKKIIFKDTAKNHADLKIQLKFHNLDISKFFRAVVKGFLEKDEGMMDFVDRLKDRGKTRNVAQRKTIKKVEKDAQEVSDRFGIDSSDLESIFDIAEQEHPEL